jgi:hypothetical protein
VKFGSLSQILWSNEPLQVPILWNPMHGALFNPYKADWMNVDEQATKEFFTLLQNFLDPMSERFKYFSKDLKKSSIESQTLRQSIRDEKRHWEMHFSWLMAGLIFSKLLYENNVSIYKKLFSKKRLINYILSWLKINHW